MAKFNAGKFDGTTYIKQVSFSKAVLWKDKQISLSPRITCQFKDRGIETIIFEDVRKNERWTASLEELRTVAVLKTEGQEEQFYFPIGAFKVTKIRKTKEPKEPQPIAGVIIRTPEPVETYEQLNLI